MNAEAFLAARTGRCERLHMRLTPEACRALREKKANFHEGKEGPPPQCEGCQGVRMDGTQGAEMEKKTYTITELAMLLGAPRRVVENAKQWKSSNPRPGSGVHAVQEGMKARGITWDQVVPEQGRKWKAAEAAPVPVVRLPSLSQAIAAELDTSELMEDAVKRVDGSGPVPGSIGTAMSLEDILGELRRRLPGAAITIALQP